MKLSQQSQAIIESAIQKAINKYTCGCEQTIVTDIHIQPNQNSGELFIYDDEDEELSSVTIDEWTAYEGDDFYEDAERIFRTVLCRMKENGSFDKLTILKPYSFVLVDEDKETISELLLVDDDTLLVNDELLKGRLPERPVGEIILFFSLYSKRGHPNDSDSLFLIYSLYNQNLVTLSE